MASHPQDRNWVHTIMRPSSPEANRGSHLKKILVVDDEPDIVELVRHHLQQAGFQVLTARDGREALDLTQTQKPNLVVLDLMIPVLSGTEVARILKQGERTRHIPILMLTARGEETDRVVGFELGADDYVVKPFSPRELVLRIQAILKRDDTIEEKRSIAFPPLLIDLESHLVLIGSEELALTSTEFRLLHYLARKPGRVYSRDQLLNEVWGYGDDVESRTVDTHIKRLRGKLKSAGDWIQTVRGVGYRFRPPHQAIID